MATLREYLFSIKYFVYSPLKITNLVHPQGRAGRAMIQRKSKTLFPLCRQPTNHRGLNSIWSHAECNTQPYRLCLTSQEDYNEVSVHSHSVKLLASIFQSFIWSLPRYLSNELTLPCNGGARHCCKYHRCDGACRASCQRLQLLQATFGAAKSAPQELRFLSTELSVIEQTVLAMSNNVEYHDALSLCNEAIGKLHNVVDKYAEVTSCGTYRSWSKRLAMALDTDAVQKHTSSLRVAKGHLLDIHDM
jgi:hypothetical protein